MFLCVSTVRRVLTNVIAFAPVTVQYDKYVLTSLLPIFYSRPVCVPAFCFMHGMSSLVRIQL